MMYSSLLPKNIERVFELENIDLTLSVLMREIVDLLQCDRCFIYVRNPDTRWGKAAFCYCLDVTIPDVTNEEWSQESSVIEKEDPMFAAALNCQPHIFVEDVETADPQVVNRQFEAENFGHRALIHAHLCLDGKLWGVLQPCVFSEPRIWTKPTRQLITELVDRTTPLVKAYVQKETNLITQEN